MHDVFLKQIADNPRELLPRLIYADWLEERGDPRGEFIRLQCRWAELDPLSAEAEPLERR